MKNVISKVCKGSIAEEVGIEVGDLLLSINKQPVEDIIEYKFYLAEEELEVEIEKPNGEKWIVEIEKGYDEDLGIEFENPIIDQAKSCKNKCMFCFIDQLPPNMRESLYFKDDDSRLSFLHGNYITLTNMSEEDIDKIIQYRISPINISVHTTNGELRKKMLNNRFAGNILERLKRLAEAQIAMNCQIVLCPDVNDKAELDNTIKDLVDLSHSIKSVAIVPVGLTAYREGLLELQPFTPKTAGETVRQVEKWQKKLYKKLGRNFVYVSDEFYILGDMPFPAYESYGGFPQLENGVGMVVKFKEEFYQYLEKLSIVLKKPKKVTVATGTSACNFITNLCKDFMKKVPNLYIDVVCIQNQFFGGHVSVSGLITGSDIRNQLKNRDLGEKMLIPESMLKSGEEVFLDDVTVTELEKELGIPIQVCEVQGKQFVKRIISSNLKLIRER